MMTQDNCLICKMPLFGEHGERLVAECYGVYLMRQRANSHGTYSDCGKGQVYLCPDCWEFYANTNIILDNLREQQVNSDSMEKIKTEGDWICQ